MTSNTAGSDRILGSLRTEDGEGIARMEDRFGTSIDEVWSALTEPQRLASWYGEVAGDLRLGGEFHVRHADGERTGHVDTCVSPRHLRIRLRDVDARPGQPEEIVMGVELAIEGGQTILVVEVSGLPVPLLAAYGTGVQIHVEHLADHLAARESDDTKTRWEKLFPSYEELAAELS